MSTLYALMTAAPYLAALGLGVLVPMLGVICYSNVGAGLAVIVGMFCVEALWMTVGGFQLGIRIYYTDFALVFIGAIALLRLLTAHDTPRWHWAWSMYTIVFLVSLCTGVLAYGSGAGVQARGYFYSIAAGSYAMSFVIQPRHVRLLLHGLLLVSVLLLCICAYRWVVYYTPITELLPDGGSYNTDGAIRVVRSFEAVVLSQVFVIGLFFAAVARSAMLARVLSPLVLAVVIALQHRSVWLALLVGIAAGLFVSRTRSGSRLSQLLLLAGIVTLTALPMVFSEKLSGVSDQVAGSANRAVAAEGSVGERFDNWQGLVKIWAAGGPRSILIGQSFGSDATRYVRDKVRGGEHKIEYFAHNHYVQTLFNMGLIGLTAFVVVTVYVMRGLYRLCRADEGDPTAEVLLTLMVMQLAYYVPYGTDYLQSVILGVAIAYVAGHERAARASAAAAHPIPRRRLGWGWS
ncbi:MAG: O-antigen ligase family protein [Rhizobiales bacterium]|nr:O-antigen ligase family protein [Rhizobacter sp.]